MKRPLVSFTGVFCLGIAAANFIRTSFWPVYAAAAFFLMLSILLIHKEAAVVSFIYIIIFLLGMVSLENSRKLSKCCVANFIAHEADSQYVIKGVIESKPLIMNEGTTFVFAAQKMQRNGVSHDCCGNILVRVKDTGRFNYAEELILCGNVYLPYAAADAGKRNYRRYLYDNGIYAIMNVKTTQHSVRLRKGNGNKIKVFSFWLKEKAEGILYKYLSFVPAAVLDAMVLGEKRNIPQALTNSMIQSGTIHVLVVSGFNVAIVSSLIALCLKLMRIPRKLRILIACCMLVVYCVMTGATTPVLRATIMAAVFMSSYFVKRNPDIYNSASVAALSILLINPRQLFDIGFQLSFVSVLSIVYFYPRIKSFLRLDSLKNKCLKFLSEAILVSFSAWLGTAGFIVYYFRIVSPVTVFANIFIVPLASLITLCGFCLLIMGFIWPAVTIFFAATTEFIICVLFYINNFLIHVPGAYFYLP